MKIVFLRLSCKDRVYREQETCNFSEKHKIDIVNQLYTARKVSDKTPGPFVFKYIEASNYLSTQPKFTDMKSGIEEPDGRSGNRNRWKDSGMFGRRFYGSDMDEEEEYRRCGVSNMGSRGEPRIISRMTDNAKEIGNRVDMRLGERSELQPDGKYMSSNERGKIIPVGSRGRSTTEEGNVELSLIHI